MIQLFRFNFSILLLTACLLSPAFAAQGQSFQTLDGTGVQITDYLGKGRWAVVMMWAHDCHVCNLEAERYAHFHEENEDGNVSVIGISVDGLQQIPQAKDFVERHDLPFINLTGDTRQVMRWFQGQTGGRFLGTPTLLVYDPQGKLRAAQPGAVSTEAITKFIAANS